MSRWSLAAFVLKREEDQTIFEILQIIVEISIFLVVLDGVLKVTSDINSSAELLVNRILINSFLINRFLIKGDFSGMQETSMPLHYQIITNSLPNNAFLCTIRQHEALSSGFIEFPFLRLYFN